jgi:biopolymer transport protein ExbD
VLANALRAGYGGDLLWRVSRDEMTIGCAMRQKHLRSEKFFSDFNTLQFASVMGIVLFVILLAFMVQPVSTDGGVSVDRPMVRHATSMPGALREDAMTVSILRDGKVYFGSDQIDPTFLPQKIAERLKDRGVERKVYVAADMRARWGGVKKVLDGIRSVGTLRVAFLVNQRKA